MVVKRTVAKMRETKPDEDSGIMPARHFYPGACFQCYKMASEDQCLLRCAQCQLVSYCSKQCQKQDWKSHKKFCQLNTCKPESIFSKFQESESSWQDFIQSKIQLLLDGVRETQNYELEIYSFPRVCNVCKISKSNLLTSCKECYSVFYCCEEHRESDSDVHKKFCSEFLLCLQCDAYEASKGIQNVPLPLDVDTVYTKLSSDMKAFLQPQLVPNDGSKLDLEVETIISERLSYSLSLLYALENIEYGGTKISEREELTVHVVGAKTYEEICGIIRWEYFLHRLPSLKKFHVVFVGEDLYGGTIDEIPTDDDRHVLDDTGITRCADCVANGRILVYEMAYKTYPKFCDSVRYSKPDVAITFNPIFEDASNLENESIWAQALENVLDATDTPFIITSLTEEDAKSNLSFIDQLDDIKYKTLMATKLNPYKSLRPIRNMKNLADTSSNIMYKNQFIVSLIGRE